MTSPRPGGSDRSPKGQVRGSHPSATPEWHDRSGRPPQRCCAMAEFWCPQPSRAVRPAKKARLSMAGRGGNQLGIAGALVRRLAMVYDATSRPVEPLLGDRRLWSGADLDDVRWADSGWQGLAHRRPSNLARGRSRSSKACAWPPRPGRRQSRSNCAWSLPAVLLRWRCCLSRQMYSLPPGSKADPSAHSTQAEPGAQRRGTAERREERTPDNSTRRSCADLH